MVAFNVLRSIGQEVVALAEYAPKKIKVARWRLKTVLQEVIYSACRIVSHAGRFFLNFGSHCPWFDVQPFAPSLGLAKERQRPIEQPQGRRPWHARITKIARNRGY